MDLGLRLYKQFRGLTFAFSRTRMACVSSTYTHDQLRISVTPASSNRNQHPDANGLKWHLRSSEAVCSRGNYDRDLADVGLTKSSVYNLRISPATASAENLLSPHRIPIWAMLRAE